MSKIEVSELLEAFRYEPETGKLFRAKQIEKSKSKIGDELGTISNCGYYTVYLRKRKLLVHRIAWAIVYGEWPSKGLDHINMIRLDNRIENLRLATVSQNLMNIKSYGISGIKGVRQRSKAVWTSRIGYQRKVFELGAFDNPDEAAHAYNKKAIELFGEFAVLNPIGADYV